MTTSMTINNLKIEAEKSINQARDLKALDEIFKKYLGKKGELTLILRSIKSLPQNKRKQVGQQANQLRKDIEQFLDNKKKNIQHTIYKIQNTFFDVTVPGRQPVFGHLHPLTLVRRKAEEIFENMGFSIVDGPEMESEWYNFDALNIPKDHPSRDLWDTFYLKNGLLLRTHTSPVQIRYMEKHNPPLRIIVPGNVYRHEATDVSHEFQLCQIEGLMVGKKISVANLKAIVGEFFRRFFEKNVGFRLRPDYFSFVEPGFDISIICVVCGGKGCSVCKGSGWVEVAGAGMVHPNVFKACGLISKEWQGWAFGFGLERLAMMKYKINDIRLFRSNDLRFLQQF